jgi:hypothetical protein
MKYAIAILVVLVLTLKLYHAPANKPTNMTVIYWKEYTP